MKPRSLPHLENLTSQQSAAGDDLGILHPTDPIADLNPDEFSQLPRTEQTITQARTDVKNAASDIVPPSPQQYRIVSGTTRAPTDEYFEAAPGVFVPLSE